MPDEILRQVRVAEVYDWDGLTRYAVKILEGPEKGRIVSGLSKSNLREDFDA